jgi:hypothetical protein
MLKKTLFAVFGLAMVLAFVTPEKAHAGVAIGVTVGGPVYARPAYPYAYAYPRPYVPAYAYRPYVYPAPVVYGNFYRGPYGRGERFERHERFERQEHFEHRGYYGHDRR